MLGDQAEKSRNPLRTAMKRRKTKTVAFAQPTYVDYSEIEYSTDEEDLESEYFSQQDAQARQSGSQAASDSEVEDEGAKVEPLKPRSQQGPNGDPQKQSSGGDGANGRAASGMARNSEEIFDAKSAEGPKKSSDGTVRDSFFKDDTVETKKITLTPNLLRDDNAPRSSTESKEAKQRPSLDKLDKESILGKDDKKKSNKKEKEKKPSAIRSFFSRKGRKDSDATDEEILGKRSMETDGHDREFDDDEGQISPERAVNSPQRHPSKLQKQQPRAEPSPTRRPSVSQPKESGTDLATILAETRVNNVANVPPASMRIVDSSAQASTEDVSRRPSQDKSPREERSAASAAKAASSRIPDGNDRSRTPTTKSEARAADFVSPRQETADESSPLMTTREAADDIRGNNSTQPSQREPVLGSPVQVSPLNSNNPPPLMVDTSSQEDHSSSRSTPSPGIENEDAEMHGKQDSVTTSTSTTTATAWNDASLRAFFDSGSDIRDLLVVVYDKTDVVPAGPDHPIAGTLFKEPNAKLAEITTVSQENVGGSLLKCEAFACLILTFLSTATRQHAWRLASSQATLTGRLINGERKKAYLSSLLINGSHGF